MIAGQLFAGSGADTVVVGGSLGGTVELSEGADDLTAVDAKEATVWVVPRMTASPSQMFMIPVLLVGSV